MSWLQTQMALLDAATASVEFAVNWFLQSTMLITIGLAVGSLLGRFGSAAQSAVYRTTLAAVLICPIASWLLSLAGVSGWSLALPRPWIYEPAKRIVADAALPARASPTTNLPVVVDSHLSTPLEASDELEQASVPGTATDDVGASHSVGPVEAMVPSPLAAESTNQEAAKSPAGNGTLLVRGWGWAALSISAIWTLICIAWLARLAAAWWRLSRLRHGAVPADAATMRTCRELAGRLGVATPEVLRSPYLPSPCLAGLRRPAVLLPEAELSLSVRDVLIHELAHLARHDCHWNLLRQLALSAFFFQPLLWKLSRRLETTAEEVCDDFVVQHGGDRQQYAHRLVDIAELSTAPVAAAGVGIVSLRSMLAQRVQRILDTSRSLSTRVGSLLLTVVLAGGLVGTMIVGLVGIGPRPSVAEAAPSESRTKDGDQGAKDDTVARDTDTARVDDGMITVRGRVLGPTGRPVAGATVYAAWGLTRREPPSQRVEHKIVAQTKSDAQGDFELKFSTDHPDMTRLTTGWHIAALAPGLGPAWRRDVHLIKDASAKSTTTLTLTRDQAIRGRIVDLEGNPLAGVQVRIHELRGPETERAMLDWIQEAKEKSPPPKVDDYFDGTFRASGASQRKSPYAGAFPTLWDDGGLAHGAPALPVDAQTDKEGRFQLNQLGGDRLAVLEIEGPAIAKCYVHVVTRDMEALSARPFESYGVRTGTYFGRDFEFVAEPTQPISGTVTDAETGQPLANVEVHVQQFAGNLLGQQDFLDTRTDEQGHYKLIGAPFGGGHRIEVSPSTDQPYFPTQKRLDKAPGVEPVRLDFVLRRGQWIAGKVRDRESNAPIKDAVVEYLPLRSNKHAQDYPNYRPEITGHTPSDRYRTSGDGSFRVLAIPGAGILAAIAREEDRHNYSSLNEDLVPKHLVQSKRHLNTYHPWVVTGYHALREVELSKPNEEVAYDLELTRGSSRVVKLVDTQGQAVKGARVLGRRFPPQLEDPASDSAVEVIGLRANDGRDVVFIHSERRIGKAVTISAGDETTVELEPCAVARGRVIDEDRQPVRDLEVNVSVDRPDNWHRGLIGATTGADGRFEVLLPPGTTYRIWHYSKKGADFSAECQSQSGAVFELGDLANGAKLSTDQTEKLIATQKAGAQSEAEIPPAEKAPMPTPPGAAPQAERANTRAPDAAERVEFAGKVVDPAGKPVAGAQVKLLYNTLRRAAVTPAVVTAVDGTFRLAISRKALLIAGDKHPWPWGTLVASGDGLGFDWAFAPSFETSGEMLKELSTLHDLTKQGVELVPDRTLRLVEDDAPIDGRIINLEGQGIAGVTIRAVTVHANRKQDLGPWLAAIESGEKGLDQAWPHFTEDIGGLGHWDAFAQVLPGAVTDAEGRFRIAGAGRERLVQLQISGKSIETRLVYARTRPGATLDIKYDSREPDSATAKCYATRLEFVAAPSRPVVGIVRDVDTREPLTGVTIVPESIAGGRLNGTLSNGYIHATTDAEGRYRLEGLPIGKSTIVAVPRYDQPHVLAARHVETGPAKESTMLDFELKRGVWIRGRVTDAQSGKPLQAQIEYFAFVVNPHVNAAPGLLRAMLPYNSTDTDGRYEIAGLPGRGLITVMAQEERDAYPRGAGAEKIEGGRAESDHRMFLTHPYHAVSVNAHFIAEVNPDPSAEAVECNVALRAGRVIEGTVLDPDAAPLAGARCAGQLNVCYWASLDSEKFRVRHLAPGQERRLFFYHEQRKLAGSLLVRGEEAGPFSVKLETWGVVKGRVLTEHGDAADRVALVTRSGDVKEADRGVLPDLPRPQTDEKGYFTIEGLAPGLTYALGATRGSRYLGSAMRNVKLLRGETKDLGDVRLADEGKSNPPAKQARKESPDMPAQQVVVTGQVNLPGGKPAAAAHVAVVAVRVQPVRGGDLHPGGETLAEGRTDGNGHYQLSLKGASSKTHRYASVIARKDGFAIAWQRLDLDAQATEASLVLASEEPIRGRLVDIEGQPAGGVPLSVRSVTERSDDGEPAQKGVGYHGDTVPAAWLQSVTSDDAGRFTLHGIPAGHGVFLDVAGSDRFAPQDIALNTGMPEQRGESDGTYRPLVRNAASSDESLLPLAPAQLFEGQVTYEDTGKPAPHARLTIWASQQQHGSMISVAGQADEQGRYRISPHPGIRFGINAYPADGAAYLARQTPLSEAIEWRAGDRVKQVDIKLPRGVLVRGTVVESGTSAPVAGASIQYHPESANNKHKADHILTGWQGIKLSDEHGKFEITVLPGSGRLLVHGPQGKYVLKETSGQELNRGKPGGQRTYAHAIERIEPAPGADPIDLTVKLEPGATLSGRLVDEQGQPIDEALVISRLFILPGSPWWRGYGDATPPTLGGKFELSGLDANQEYTVYFLDAKRRLGATQVLRAGSTQPTVVLKPCGLALARFVDSGGQPHVGWGTGLHMVVTPGEHEHDSAAAKLGKLAADADFVANIDQTNYWPAPRTDPQGRVTFPALVPGATYRIDTYDDGKPRVLKQFSVKAGEQIDLGEISINLDR